MKKTIIVERDDLKIEYDPEEEVIDIYTEEINLNLDLNKSMYSDEDHTKNMIRIGEKLSIDYVAVREQKGLIIRKHEVDMGFSKWKDLLTIIFDHEKEKEKEDEKYGETTDSNC